jgi:tripartite-type tricarboxylate transporter receptor subunit TctC
MIGSCPPSQSLKKDHFMSPVRALRSIVIGAVASLAVFGAPAHAQKYPTKPIRLVIGFPPGGSSDVVGRSVADGAREVLGQPIVVENVGGAGGNIGMARAAKAPPDGYTLSLCTIGTCAINPSIYANPGYDLKKDYAPVFLVGGVMNIFTVHPSMPVKTIKEFVGQVKANPGKIPMAIGGIGSSNHLTPVWFANIAGLNILYVPFKGSGDSITALLGGEVVAFVDNEPSILPHIQSGRVRALSVTGPKRSTHLPDTPTMIESGYKGFVVEPWFGFQVPAGTPAPVIQTLNQAFNQAVQNPRVAKRLQDAGLRVVGGPPERLAEQIASESARWAKVVKDNKIKAD